MACVTHSRGKPATGADDPPIPNRYPCIIIGVGKLEGSQGIDTRSTCNVSTQATGSVRGHSKFPASDKPV
jgi:hypothetical protein